MRDPMFYRASSLRFGAFFKRHKIRTMLKKERDMKIVEREVNENKEKISKLLYRARIPLPSKGWIDDRILSAKYKGGSRSPRGRKFNKRKIKEDEREREREGENFIENFSRADESFLTLGRFSIFYMH